MKNDIYLILKHWECDNSKITELRDWLASLSDSLSDELMSVTKQLQDAIPESDTQSHKDIHTLYFFLGYVYYEQGRYDQAVDCLKNAVFGTWRSRVNKSLIKWLTAIVYVKKQDFPKARLELDEALRLLETSASLNSLRENIENRKRQTIRQGITDRLMLLESESFFRIPLTSDLGADTFQTDSQSKNQTGTRDILREENQTYQETYSSDDVPVFQNLEKSKAIPEEANGNLTSNVYTEGYISFQSLPVYEQHAAASNPGKPLSTLKIIGMTETKIILLDNKAHAIWPMKRADNNINIKKNVDMGWVRVTGLSMNGIEGRTPIMDSDFVLVQFTVIADDNDIVLASIDDLQTTQSFLVVKRYRRDTQILQSETTEKGAIYDDISMGNANKAKIFGVVIAVAKPISTG